MILGSKDWYPVWYSYCAMQKFIGNYMTSLHAYPLLDRYEDTGEDFLLQMAYGSLIGHWCCVDSKGKGYNSREWRFNPVARDHPRYNFCVTESRNLELGVGLNSNLSQLGAALVFDRHFGLTGYGCQGFGTEDGYMLKPWSGFGFKASFIPLKVKLESCNAKMEEVSISRNKRHIEVQLAAPAPEITKGVLTITGLDTGSYRVSDSRESRQYQVLEDSILRIDAVSSNERLEVRWSYELR